MLKKHISIEKYFGAALGSKAVYGSYSSLLVGRAKFLDTSNGWTRPSPQMSASSSTQEFLSHPDPRRYAGPADLNVQGLCYLRPWQLPWESACGLKGFVESVSCHLTHWPLLASGLGAPTVRVDESTRDAEQR